MKKANLSLLLSAILVGSMFSSVSYSVGMDRGKMLANTCAGCHGPGGVSNGPATPTIAGMSKDYFIESMDAFALDDRPATVMNRIAKGYDEEDIEAMANYFSNQKFKSTSQPTNSNMVSKGQKLHEKYCEKCHSEGGSLAEDDAGILAGQWRPYLQYNLSDFISDDREAPRKMAKKLRKLLNKEGQAGIDALVEFYSSK